MNASVREPQPARVGVPGRLRETVVLAWFFGTATGVVQLLILAVRRYVLGQFVWVSREAVWMTPLAYVLFFIPLAFVLAFVPGPLQRVRRLWAGVYVFVGGFSLLLPFEQIAVWAAAIAALGVAVQTARSYGARPGFRRWLLPLSALGTLLLVLVGTGLAVARYARQRTAIASLPAAADSPNVLFIILDTVRSENLSLFGYGRPTTPALERHAADGIVFDRAFATAPWTLPTHGTLLTGRYAGQTGGDFLEPIPLTGRSLAEVFQARGYRTAGFVANLLYTSWESGLARGFQEYRDYPITPAVILSHSVIAQLAVFQRLVNARTPGAVWNALRRSPLTVQRLPADVPIAATEISTAFLDWQADAGDRPFFAFLNYFDAHGPYRAPPDFIARFGGARRAENRYDAAIAFVDAEVDRVMEELRRRGALDRTIVVVVSDHGELFGEHGLRGHANSLYFPLLRVPLLIRYPAGVPQGTRITAPISLRDVPATVLDLAGVAPDSEVPGVSLARFWTEADANGSTILSQLTKGVNVDSTFPNARTGLESVVEGRYHYIRNGFGEEQLFDWVADSLQQSDLAGRPEAAAALARLRHVLDSVRIQQ